MKRILTFLLFFQFSILVIGQTIYSDICRCSVNVGEDGVSYSEPIILDKQSSKNITIIGIRKYKEYFEIALKYTCSTDSTSYSIGEPYTEKAWYVYSNGRKYNLINASWMLNGPNKVMRKGAEAILHIYFDPVGKEVEKFDLIEGNNPYNANSWHFYGIQVKNHPGVSPPTTKSSDPADDLIDDLTKTMLAIEINENKQLSRIQNEVSSTIARSICPNTAKNIKYSLISRKDENRLIILDLKSEWTGAACGVCDWETYYTKDKIYIRKGYTTKPNYDVIKIENYYKSPNVAQVWSTSDVVTALALIGGGAAILSSGDDSQKSSTPASSSSGSSSSSTYNSGSSTSSGTGSNSTSYSRNQDDGYTYQYKVGDVVKSLTYTNNSGWKGVVIAKQDGKYQIEVTELIINSWTKSQLAPTECSGNKRLYSYSTGEKIWISPSCITD